jgi:hypothetical protein
MSALTNVRRDLLRTSSTPQLGSSFRPVPLRPSRPAESGPTGDNLGDSGGSITQHEKCQSERLRVESTRGEDQLDEGLSYAPLRRWSREGGQLLVTPDVDTRCCRDSPSRWSASRTVPEPPSRGSQCEFRVAALPQPRQHVPGDLFNLRVSPCQPVRPVGRPRRHHGRARLVRVRTQHRVAVTDAFHRLGLTRPEHA